MNTLLNTRPETGDLALSALPNSPVVADDSASTLSRIRLALFGTAAAAQPAKSRTVESASVRTA